MEITYDYYRIFYYVAKYKSFSKAAAALMSNQPNVSRFMNNLENQLGCKLFIRSNRGVTLTPEGEKLYHHVAIAYHHIQAAELELANDKSLANGSITIETSETALHILLLPILQRFHQTYPGIRLCISNHTTPQALQVLKSGLADFAIVTSPKEMHKPLKRTPLVQFQEILIGSSQYAFLADTTSHLSELSGYPLISLGKEAATYEFYSKLYLQHDLVWNPDTEVATTDQILPLVKNGLGIGFVPEKFALDALAAGEVCQIPLYEDIPSRTICLIEDRSHSLSIAANALKRLLLETCVTRRSPSRSV